MNFEVEPYRLYPLAGGQPRLIPGLIAGDEPIRFTSDGRRLFVRSRHPDRTKASIAVIDVASGRKQPWKVVGPADPARVVNVGYTYLSADGRAYLYNYDRVLADLFLVEGLG